MGCKRASRAVQVISLPNIGLFDGIANPVPANDESRSLFVEPKEFFYFKILKDSELAEQQEHDKHH